MGFESRQWFGQIRRGGVWITDSKGFPYGWCRGGDGGCIPPLTNMKIYAFYTVDSDDARQFAPEYLVSLKINTSYPPPHQNFLEPSLDSPVLAVSMPGK